MNPIQKIKTALMDFPPGFYVLFYTEMWELFGRFGITALLVLYMTTTLHLSDSLSFHTYSTFIALTFVTPIIGGYLSDRFFGFRYAIILGALIMVLGNCLLIVPSLPMIYLGLSIVALGSGLFTPTLAALLGRLYDQHPHNRQAGFTFYYIAKNLGALLAPVLCGIVGQIYGYNYAFILSALGMLSGFFIFAFRSHTLGDLLKSIQQEVQTEYPMLARVAALIGFLLLIIPLYCVLANQYAGELLVLAIICVMGYMARMFMKSDEAVRKHLMAIFYMTALTVVFFAFLGQGGTTLNLFNLRIVDRHFLGMEIPASAFYSLNPLFMLLMGPFIASLWTRLGKQNREPSVNTKFSIALLLLGVGFFVFYCAGVAAQYVGSASPLFVVLSYFIIPIAELCIMPIGLSVVTQLSPRQSQAMMVGIYTLGLALASYLTGIISHLGEVDFPLDTQANISSAIHIYQFNFGVSALILSGVAVVCLGLSRWVKKLFV